MRLLWRAKARMERYFIDHAIIDDNKKAVTIVVNWMI